MIYHIRAQHDNDLETKKLEGGATQEEGKLSSSNHPMLQGLLKK